MNRVLGSHRIYVGKDRHKFSSAHMTVFPDGTKERLHGHNYRVQVGLDLCDTSFENFLDFRAVKSAMEKICEEWDERMLLAENCPFMKMIVRDPRETEFILCGKRYVLPTEEVVFLPITNVSVETLSTLFGSRLKEQLGKVLNPDWVEGVEINLSEASGQGCVHYLKWNFEGG